MEASRGSEVNTGTVNLNQEDKWVGQGDTAEIMDETMDEWAKS